MAVLAARALDDEVKRRTAALKAQGKAELEAMGAQAGELPAAVVKQLAERHARREREARTVTTQAALDDLAGWLRDCVVAAHGGAPLIHVDAADAVAGDAAALGAAKLLTALDLVLETREALELNVQQALTLEAMFLDLSALSYS